MPEPNAAAVELGRRRWAGIPLDVRREEMTKLSRRAVAARRARARRLAEQPEERDTA